MNNSIQPMELDGEIAKARLAVSADGYPMSIGELTNLYRDHELIIRPEFQRLFRWSSTQKSRLVESLLLGIPLPSIFVAQTETGVWEVVDGLQRLSTIFELQGELMDTVGVKKPQLLLEATKYLPNLEGLRWEVDDGRPSLTAAQRLDIKRAKIDVKIIKRDSSPQAKFDLFQRLNSYGSQLNAQELRSAMLVAVSPKFFSDLELLSRDRNFKNVVQLSEKQFEERYDLELVTRFLVLHNWPEEKIKLSSLRDLPQILDDTSVSFATMSQNDIEGMMDVFSQTFASINENGDENVFRRWDATANEFRGPFLTSAFEVIALGIGYHIANGQLYRNDLQDLTKELWSLPSMKAGYSTGRSTESRLVEFLPLGRNLTSAK